MGITSRKKEKEKNKFESNLLSMRVGTIAYITVMLTIVDDLIDNENIGLFVGLAVLMLALYGINGKWIYKIDNNNKEELEKIIDYGTALSIFLFALQKILIFVDALFWRRLLSIIYLLILLIFIILIVSNKKWKYHVD